MLSSWLRRLFAGTRARPTHRHKPTERPRLRPSLELLEDRLAPAAGVLDPTFSGDGFLAQGFGGTELINAIAIDGAGKLVFAGSRDGDLLIGRYNADGTLDTTFDVDGTLVINLGGTDAGVGVAIDGSGKIVVAASSTTAGGSFYVLRYTAAGVLDSTFDFDGYKSVAFSGYSNVTATSMALDGLGRIVVAGYGTNTTFGDENILITQLRADGTLDTSFNGSGSLAYGGAANERVTAVAIDGFGNLVAAGTTRTGSSDANFHLLRFTPAQALDSTFDSDGVVVTNLGGNDVARSLAIDGLGRVVVAGSTTGATTGNDLALMRYNPNGSLDATFGTAGKVVTVLPTQDIFKSVAIDSDGKIVGVGYTGTDQFTARFLTTGAADVAFGVNGFAASPFTVNDDCANAVAIDARGNIVVAGFDGTDIALIRYAGDGSVRFNTPSLFNLDGIRATTMTGTVRATALDGNGRILALSDDGDAFFVVTRFLADGTIDTTFGDDGSFGSDIGYPAGIAIDPLGRIVIVGSFADEINVLRLNPDGSPDATFGDLGIRSYDFGTGNEATSVAIYPNGKIVVGGMLNSQVGAFRLNLDGTLDTSFNGTGVNTTGLTGRANGVTIDASGRIVVAGYAVTAGVRRVAIVRFSLAGAVETTINQSMQFFDAGASGNGAESVAIDGQGNIVIAAKALVGDGHDFGVMRFTPAGVLDTTFDGDGAKIVSLSTGTDVPARVLIDGAGKIVVVGSGSMPLVLVDVPVDLEILRLNADGSLDTTFGIDGKQVIPSFNTTVHDAVLDGFGRIIIGGVVNGNVALARVNPELGPAGTITDDTPTLSWPTIPGAVRYDLWVNDATTGQAQVFRNASATGNSITITGGLTPGRTYTWYLGIVNAAGVTSYNSGQNFTIPALTAPVQNGPSGTINASSGYDKPTFSWNAVSGAHHYYLYVQDNTTGTVALALPNVGNVTSFTPSDAQALTPGRSYSWYVAAVSTNGSVVAFQSTPQNFSLAALAVPTQNGPVGTIAAADDYDRPLYSWNAVAGAHHYYLYVVNNTTGAVTFNFADVGSETEIGISTGLTPGQTYTWYIGAVSSNSASISWSAGQTFTLANLPVPTQVGPSGAIAASAGFDRPTFSWNAVAGAERYHLYVVDATTGKVAIDVIRIKSLGTSYATPVEQALTPGHAYYWYLGAVSRNSLGRTYQGAPLHFSLANLGTPTQTNMTGTIAASAGYDQPTFTWNSSGTGADHHYLYVINTTTGQVVINNPNVAGSSFTVTAANALTPGHSYAWYVGAVSTNSLAVTFQTSPRTFTLAGLTAPTRNGPAGSLAAASGYDKPTFTWNAVAGAHHYYLYVQDNTTGAVPLNLPDIGNVTGFTPSDAQALTPGRSYSWYVGAVSTNGAVVAFQGTPQNFTLANLPAPTQNQPSGTIAATNNYDRPTFLWNLVSGAHHYYLYVQNNTTGTVVFNLPDVGNVTSFTPSDAQRLTPGHSYSWYVGAASTNSAAVTFQSVPQTFTLANLPAPVQNGPTGAVAPGSSYDKPVFSWNPVAGAHHYYFYLQDNTANRVLLNLPDIGNVTSFTPSDAQALTPGHSYSWYVGAVSFNGLVVTFQSTPMNFSLATLPAPSRTGPSGPIAAGANYDKPTFSWASTPGAHHYYLYVQDNTTGAVPLNLPNIGNVTSFTPSDAQALTPGRSYSWYVGAVSTNGMVTFQSAPMNFSLAALTAPVQTGPINGVVLNPASGYDRPTFTWNAVAGAHHYYLYVQDNTTGAVALNLSSVGNGTSFTPNNIQALTPGRSYSWYVGAVSTNNLATVFQSTPQTFSLAPLPAPVQTSPTTTSSTTPTFQWNAVTGADRYHLYVIDTVTGQALVNDLNVGNVTSVLSPVSLVSGRRYTWYLLAVSTNGLARSFAQAGVTIQVT